MAKSLPYESSILDKIHGKANTAKNECYFVGFLDGIVANSRVDETELEPLIAECAAICRQVNDEDAAEIIAEASAGHADTPQELLSLITQIAEVRSSSIDPLCPRSSANRLLGFCAGVNCDNIITLREAKVLYDKLTGQHDLEDDPRISSLRHVLLDALEDDVIDADESYEIGLLITRLIGDSYSDTGIPSAEAVPVIHDHDIGTFDESELEGSRIVLTGRFSFGTRREVSEKLQEYGAIIQAAPTGKTDVVIIGSEGSPHYTHKHHGGKLSKALKLRADGGVPRILSELQLRNILR